MMHDLTEEPHNRNSHVTQQAHMSPHSDAHSKPTQLPDPRIAYLEMMWPARVKEVKTPTR